MVLQAQAQDSRDAADAKQRRRSRDNGSSRRKEPFTATAHGATPWSLGAWSLPFPKVAQAAFSTSQHSKPRQKERPAIIRLLHSRAPQETQLRPPLQRSVSRQLRSYFVLYSPTLYYYSANSLIRIYIRQPSYRRHGRHQAGTFCPTVSSDSNRSSSWTAESNC